MCAGPTLIGFNDVSDVKDVGGKACAIQRLQQVGFDVPPGFIIPVGEFWRHVSACSGGFHTSPNYAHLSATLRAVPLQTDLMDAVVASWRDLGGPMVAVRSSAIAEDSRGASFAGQFHTSLHLDTPAGIAAAIRQCWASAFSPGAINYAQSAGLDADALAMAVIVQVQVRPTLAGVMFIQDPRAPSGEWAYGEWVVGLGNALVDGQRVDGHVWLNQDGILRVDSAAADEPDVRELLHHLRHANEQVRAEFGANYEYEWAWDGTRIWLLQTRPNLFEPETQTEHPPEWALAGVPLGGWAEQHRKVFDLWDEYNPSMVAPLHFDLYMAAIWDANIRMLDSECAVDSIHRFVLSWKGVPVQVDPAARNRPQRTCIQSSLCAPPLEQLLIDAKESVETIRSEMYSASTARQLFQLLLQAAELYRSLNVKRMLEGMVTWIDEIRTRHEQITNILRGVVPSPLSVCSLMESEVETETTRMRDAHDELVRLAKTESPLLNSAVDVFLEDYGHFGFLDGAVELTRRIQIEATELTNETSGASKFLWKAELDRLCGLLDTERASSLSDAVSALRKAIAFRENSKSVPELPLPLLRTLEWRLARALGGEGKIPQDCSIAILSLAELEDIVEGRGSYPAEVRIRQEVLEWKEHRSWLPPSLNPQTCRPDDRVLRGTPASPGTVSGPARLVRGPAEFHLVQSGDIVLARATSPAWTQLFNRAGGIIIENGSVLSHAVVVARERGIPCVVGLLGVLGVVQGGEVLVLDGEAGTVVRKKYGG